MSAPTRRPAGPLAGLLLAGLSSHPAAQAQTRNNTVAADVSVLVTAVRSEGVSTLNTLGNDVVTATSAGLKFQRRSGALTLDAQGRLTATHYDSGLYKDRITPTGTLAARLQPASTGFGVDVGASAQQVRPTQPNTVVSPVQLGGTYTASTAQISPFFDRDLSDTLNLQARLTRSTQQNSGNEIGRAHV